MRGIQGVRMHLTEPLRFAWSVMRANLTRSLLSLAGIGIGIFSIVLVFTIIDSLENGIRKSIRSLGSDVVYVQKWPWAFGGEYPWWKYVMRPYPTYEEALFIKKRCNYLKSVSFLFTARRPVKSNTIQTEPIILCGISYEYPRVREMPLLEGRFFSRPESDNGSRVVIIGYDVARLLFPQGNAVGQYISVGGYKSRICGVLKKEGKSMFGLSTDKQVFLPYTFMQKFINPKSEMADPFIICKVKDNISLDKAMDEIERWLRSYRKIKPLSESNFALNKITLLEKGFEDLFILITLVGWIIGGFSILVGGFGIANIMYVSVSERIQQIGIQMSLGATRFFILIQFLYEGIILSLLGGLLGLTITGVVVFFMKDFSGLELEMTPYNLLLGLQLSALVGIVSSFVPSYQASQLDPVEAMRR